MSAANEAAGIVTAASAAIKRVFEIADMGVSPGVDQRRETPSIRAMFRTGGFIFRRQLPKKCPLMAGNSEGN
jgi:hypothetical protein